MSFETFCRQYCAPDDSPVALDYSKIGMSESDLARLEPLLQRAFAEMKDLEAGAIANADENRMVGHYWLRDFSLIPDPALRAEVQQDDSAMRLLMDRVLRGELLGQHGNPFRYLLSIGIGGSALGPQFIADALGADAGDRLRPFFMDNTDPEGIDRIIAQLEGKLHETLVLVISKSGGTPETRNGMLLAEAAWQRAGLRFGAHAVAITGKGSKLDRHANDHGWIARIPMYDWIGGRTSVLSAVGLVPMGLQGIQFDQVLAGAREMDAVTRRATTAQNPAAIMAAAWYHATNGRGEKDLVVLPYKDRLLLLSRYLQQLIMESLGKEHDRAGKVVEQGIAVYGNKGSTDQHAYVQQLRDGVNNFFATFIEVLADGGNAAFEVEPGITAGDYLSGFFLGTRTALAEKKRQSLTITIDRVSPFTVGALVALFERAVSFYASMVNINAYHQPGVEAGKKAAAVVLELQRRLIEAMAAREGELKSAAEWAALVGGDPETSFRILQHLAHNKRATMTGRHPASAIFGT